jgi:hypothetical protein
MRLSTFCGLRRDQEQKQCKQNEAGLDDFGGRKLVSTGEWVNANI